MRERERKAAAMAVTRLSSTLLVRDLPEDIDSGIHGVLMPASHLAAQAHEGASVVLPNSELVETENQSVLLILKGGLVAVWLACE